MQRFVDRDGLDWLVYWRRGGSGKPEDSGLHFWSRAVQFFVPMASEPENLSPEELQAAIDRAIDGEVGETGS